MVEEKQNEEITEEFDVEEEEVEETKTKTKNKNEYKDVIEEMPELKQDLDYLLIIKKIKAGEKVSKKDLEFKEVYEEAKRKEQEFALESERKYQEEQERQKGMQEAINKEYEEMKANHPEKIEVTDTKNLSLRGSDNFLKVATTWMGLIKSKKKGGKLLIKVSKPKKVSIEWTNKDLKFVEFWSTNERGDKVKDITRINEFKYTFEGTSIPVLFAVQGVAESYDFYELIKKDLTSETVSGIAMEAYNSGYKDGLVLSDSRNKNDLLAFLTQWMPLILIVGLAVIAWMLWQNYDAMKATYSAVQAMQSQINLIAPSVDVNALVVR